VASVAEPAGIPASAVVIAIIAIIVAMPGRVGVAVVEVLAGWWRGLGPRRAARPGSLWDWWDVCGAGRPLGWTVWVWVGERRAGIGDWRNEIRATVGWGIRARWRAIRVWRSERGALGWASVWDWRNEIRATAAGHIASRWRAIPILLDFRGNEGSSSTSGRTVGAGNHRSEMMLGRLDNDEDCLSNALKTVIGPPRNLSDPTSKSSKFVSEFVSGTDSFCRRRTRFGRLKLRL
jgi:hypothetical protein